MRISWDPDAVKGREMGLHLSKKQNRKCTLLPRDGYGAPVVPNHGRRRGRRRGVGGGEAWGWGRSLDSENVVYFLSRPSPYYDA